MWLYRHTHIYLRLAVLGYRAHILAPVTKMRGHTYWCHVEPTIVPDLDLWKESVRLERI